MENLDIISKILPDEKDSVSLEKFVSDLKKNKASLSDVAQILGDALYATETISVKNNSTGKVEQDIVPDYAMRLKASELILKVTRLLSNDEQKETIDGLQMNVNVIRNTTVNNVFVQKAKDDGGRLIGE